MPGWHRGLRLVATGAIERLGQLIKEISRQGTGALRLGQPEQDHKANLSDNGVLKLCLSSGWSIAQAPARGGVSIGISIVPTR
jgi:hypothetical protein